MHGDGRRGVLHILAILRILVQMPPAAPSSWYPASLRFACSRPFHERKGRVRFLFQRVQILLHHRIRRGVVFAGPDILSQNLLFDVAFDAFVFFDPHDGFFGEP